MRNFYFTFILFSLSVFAFAQTNTSKANKSKENLLNNEYAVSQQSAMHVSSSSSSYFGYDNQISSIMLDNIIPDSFPKQKVNQTKEDYLLVMNNWVSNNKQLLKEDSKNFKFNSNSTN